ncbi:hypothetical protein [Pseudarthrobacter sulfonivorans]|uniref:hypothetical protein n=1 Tax=Pseudarthrobacter sulfonivorans TaxID=121292 RepID=UPI002105C43E|nr:hypothetical protein [Pseudarthrobacter sulfonivorans]
METMTSHRRPKLAVVFALLAVSGGLTAAYSVGAAPDQSTFQEAATVSMAHNHGSGSSSSVPAAQLELRLSMRTLWAQHMEWTRLAIVDFASGSAGFDTTAGRLLQDQADIGDAIKPFYGDAAGARLTTLLQTHITEFVGLFQAAKAQDAAGLETAKTAVYANAREIADFLAAANPQSWKQDEMRSMMKEHIDQTISYGSAELNGRYAEGIATYDLAEQHMLMMADDLSDVIINAFPGRFR